MFPFLVSARCVNDGPRGYLSIRTNADPRDKRTDRIGGEVGILEARAAHHADDAFVRPNLTLFEQPRQRRHRSRPGRLDPNAFFECEAALHGKRFIVANAHDRPARLAHGIQRVDACRAPDGELLLVELEDLNPYLSLDLVDDRTRDGFVTAMARSLHRFLAD